jgi:transcriptional regulator with XRE-family HTH domain
MIVYSLPEYLNALLEQKGITRADVVRGSLLDRAYLYQIFSGEKSPSRDKLIALAFGMGLTDKEAQKVLKLSGNRELYARDERDALILFELQRKKDIFETNVLLNGHGVRELGVPG